MRLREAGAGQTAHTGHGEPGSTGAYAQQFTGQADKAEATIAAEHRATIAAAKPWPPRAAPVAAPAAEPHSTLEWQPEADQDTAHVDPAWWAQIKAEQTACVQADRAARREASARAIPVNDAELELHGTAHETSSRYYARMQSYARWQLETHPEANAEPEASREAYADMPDHAEIEM